MNHLYYGDNLRVLRESIKDDSVDLIYLDPPFNSNASYNVLFKGPKGNDSAAQIEAFDDTWHWNDCAEEAFGDVVRGPNAATATMLRDVVLDPFCGCGTTVSMRRRSWGGSGSASTSPIWPSA